MNPDDTLIDQNPKQSINDRLCSEHGIGVLALIACGLSSYFYIVSPLLVASHHEESVSFSMKEAVVIPILLSVGFIKVIMDDRSMRILGPRQKASPLGRVDKLRI